MEQPKVYNTEEELIKWLEDDLEEQSEAKQSKIIKFLFCGLLAKAKAHRVRRALASDFSNPRSLRDATANDFSLFNLYIYKNIDL